MELYAVMNESDGGITRKFRNHQGTAFVFATHARRGGCLYAGEITLYDATTGRSKSIDSTTPPAGNIGDTNEYIGQLYRRHMVKD